MTLLTGIAGKSAAVGGIELHCVFICCITYVFFATNGCTVLNCGAVYDRTTLTAVASATGGVNVIQILDVGTLWHFRVILHCDDLVLGEER